MNVATSIESGVPFLGNVVIDLKQSLRYRKRVLKDITRRYLPHEIIDRHMAGFAVPLRSWFRSEGPIAKLLEGIVAGRALAVLLEPAVPKRLVCEHRNGTHGHGNLLWGVLNLGLWRDAFRC